MKTNSPPAGEATRSKKQRLVDGLRKFAVPILLVVVALHQFYRVHAEGLSSWRGGGFGMYGGYHPTENDLWRIDVETGEAVRYAKKKGEATEDEYYRGLRPFLTYVNEDALARHLDTLPPEVAEKTRLEVWRPDFDPETGRLGRHLLISAGPPAAAENDAESTKQEGGQP